MLSEPTVSAPYIQVIWNTPVLRSMLLSELSAWINGPLAPNSALSALQEIESTNRELLRADYRLWSDSLTMIEPDEGLAELSTKLEKRPEQLIAQLVQRGAGEWTHIPIEQSKGGHLVLDGKRVDAHATRLVVPAQELLLIEAVPADGMSFSGWKGMQETSPLLLIEPDFVERLEPQFKKKEKPRP